MRIIAGKLKAKKINGPKTEKVRPTLDRVKEALFSILEPYIKEANVLDLFTGTGNLGIESLSRGANFAWLNDKEISTVISNIKLTKLENCVKITRKDYTRCLDVIQKEDICFDVIFLDPPYDSILGLNTLKIISDSRRGEILSDDGIIVYETDKNFMRKNESKVFDNFSNLQCVDKRSYGNVILMLYKWR